MAIVEGSQGALVAGGDAGQESGVLHVRIARPAHGRITQRSVWGWLIHSTPVEVTHTSSSSPM